MNKGYKLSIIVGFRDRDLSRVKRFLDSLANQTDNRFELIFVNSGSDNELSLKLEYLLKGFSFCKYIHNQTKGMPWNRSLALNSGIRRARGEYILTTDIDLIFSVDFVKRVIQHVSPTLKIHSRVFQLPQKFTDWNQLGDLKKSFPLSSPLSLGLITIFHKDVAESLNGYDEYYKYWGVEDTDFCERMNLLGLETKWMNEKETPIYHQWHPHAIYSRNYSMPIFWYEEIKIHFAKKRNVLKRNSHNWGHIYSINDRPALVFFEKNKKKLDKIVLPENDLNFYKGEFIINLIEKFNSLKSEQGLIVEHSIKVRDFKTTSYLNRILLKFCARSLQKNGYSVLPKNEAENFRYFNLWPDVRNIFWYIINNFSSEVLDYYIDMNSGKFSYVLVKK